MMLTPQPRIFWSFPAVSSHTLDVLAIGNAIVDVIARADEASSPITACPRAP